MKFRVEKKMEGKSFARRVNEHRGLLVFIYSCNVPVDKRDEFLSILFHRATSAPLVTSMLMTKRYIDNDNDRDNETISSTLFDRINERSNLRQRTPIRLSALTTIRFRSRYLEWNTSFKGVRA